MDTSTIDFSTAYKDLESIYTKIQQAQDLPIDEVVMLQKKAQELHDFLQKYLRDIDLQLASIENNNTSID